MAEECSGEGECEEWTESVVTRECVEELLDFFAKTSYRARVVDRRCEIIHKMCLHLIARDYVVEVIDNKAGQLCGHYPSELIVMEGHQDPSTNSHETDTSNGHGVNNASQLKDLITTARFARCRSRFVMPVLLFEGKNICRSSTLSTMAELYGRSGVDWLFTGGEALGSAGEAEAQRPSSTLGGLLGAIGGAGGSNESEWVLLSRVRGQDVQLLKALGVELICDLMVENKKVKYGLHVCSSEKIDKFARYSDFIIASMPYPGCEFFKEYKDNSRAAQHLHFDWSQPGVDAELALPEGLLKFTHMPFDDYKRWDLTEITQNYLQILLHYIQYGDGGLLIHCISGWDRTPLFISLLRLSLWADGKAHCSLNPLEILYLTLAYDWFIYGHQLKERLEKGEEVLFFCFDFLSCIVGDEFSVNKRSDSPVSPCSRGSSSACSNLSSTEEGFRVTASGPSSGHTSGSWQHHSHSTSELDDSLTRGHHRAAATLQPPHTGELDSEAGSWQHISLDDRADLTSNGTGSVVSPGLKPSHQPPPNRSQSQGSIPRGFSQTVKTSREHKLLEVRRLFLRVYHSSIPELYEVNGGGMSWAGLLAKLGGSTFV